MFQLQFNPFAIPTLLTALLLFIIGITVLIKSQQRYLKTIFFLFCQSLIIWLLAFSAMYLSPDKYNALNWARIGFIGVLFIPILGYHLILVFIESKRRLLLILLYIISIPALALIPTEYIYKDVAKYFWGHYPVAGKLYIIFTAMFFCLFTWDVILLLKALNYYKKTNNNLKIRQTKYLLYSFIFAIPATVDYIVKYGVQIYPYGYIATLIFMSSISYAIVKHKLLDINIIFQKTIIYSIIIGALFIISSIFLYTVAQLFPQKNYWLTLILVSILAILFQPLYRWSASLVDKLFFKGTLPQLAEELHHAEKLASLGVLASGLAHEIKNPLAPIKTYMQNLPKNLNNPDFIDKITKVIPEEVDKITDIINQLRDFANPPPLSISKVNIHNLIDKRLNLLEQDLLTKNIAVQKYYSPSLPEINADPTQLERVFLNLFLNSIEAMPNGGKLTITAEQSNNQVLIKVSDTGIGIEKEVLPYIFDPFYTKGKNKGMGIGLAIVYQTIKKHNADIKVESTHSKGTTFCISLSAEHRGFTEQDIS